MRKHDDPAVFCLLAAACVRKQAAACRRHQSATGGSMQAATGGSTQAAAGGIKRQQAAPRLGAELLRHRSLDLPLGLHLSIYC